MSTAPIVRVDKSLRRGLAAFDADRLRWLDAAAALGPLAGLQFGPVTAWVLSDTEAARAMLVTDGDSWIRPPTVRAPIRLAVGDNLFTQSNRAWARLQPQVAPAFRKRALDARLAGLDELLAPEVAKLPIDTPIDLDLATGRIALVAAAWVLLGERLDRDRADELADHQRHIVAWVGRRMGVVSGFLPVAYGRRAREMRVHRRALRVYADELIGRARTREGSPDDVLGALIAARSRGRPLRAAALRGHVLGLFFAGNETTSAALSWALVHGAQNPHEWARLRNDPARASVFLEESLRLTPAVWGFPRTPTRKGVALEVDGHQYPVRRGQVITVYLRAVNRDPALWPEPDHFEPDRHLTPGREQSRALIPFGLGPRGCIGQHLAMAEMIAVLPALARHGDVVVDGSLTPDASFALRVAGGLRGSFSSPRTT